MSAYDKGRGKLILFLHGYLSDKESFARQLNFFSSYFRVVAVDMTGFGKSPPMRYPYSLDDYAEEIKKVIDETGCDKVDVVAHSFGARVLVKLLKIDDRIDKIVLTGAAGLKRRPNALLSARKTVFKLLKKFVPKEKLVRFYSSDYRRLSPVMRESFKKIISEDLRERYGEIKNKALIIFGAKDRETPLYMAKRMKKLIVDSKFIVVPDAGHFCFIDDPGFFNSRVFSFLIGN